MAGKCSAHPARHNKECFECVRLMERSRMRAKMTLKREGKEQHKLDPVVLTGKFNIYKGRA